jgi:transposase-like protein
MNTKFSIVVDREKSIVNALKKVLPAVKVVHCWNHIIKDVQLWCRKHGAPKGDISVYCDDLRELFHSAKEEDYEVKLTEKKDVWDSVFTEYYTKEIHPEVSISIGRWVLEKYFIYNPYSGITNNQSEGFNR